MLLDNWQNAADADDDAEDHIEGDEELVQAASSYKIEEKLILENL